jgi:hypothetical protein
VVVDDNDHDIHMCLSVRVLSHLVPLNYLRRVEACVVYEDSCLFNGLLVHSKSSTARCKTVCF